MRRFTSIVLAMIMVIMSLSTTAFADDKKVQGPINISSKTAILMDVGSGQILFEKNPHEKLPPASVTKVMTMLLIVEALDSGKIKLDDEVQISERASEMGGSQIFLEPGETQKVDDLLKGIAVASANDACVAMAEYVGGSEEEFVAMMNNKAKQLGMNDTNFSNTNGLPIENHYTSAHDIAIMSRELLKHDKITKYLTTWMDQIVVGKKKTTIGLANTNKMIKHYQGATGVKTGFTQEAKYCLSASAKRGETHLVAVTLGAPTTQERFKDSSSLLSYGFANYESVKLCSKSDKIATLTLDKADDNKVNLVAKDDLTALIKKGESKDFTKKIDVSKNIDLPVKKGTKLGTISIYKGDKQVGKIDLINEKDINKASYFKMFERVIDNIF
ncbi:D-alanyl-D-alanine carboxypeptidase dacC precursor [uncultured Clostridium sp.]|uniref:serine-type D-Ala-D-Ala carboxypeptidase n=2 Tax=Paeniclostridium hominis TaxID=2764329 RepID=A0ABR7JZV9_9FIRM|nr:MULTISPECIES: D-alanyl-D-alanine carboxypeptidase family protein [Paeniclostridium]MDU1539281.1 D-alanyl-D-alanine carboxypeptidase family protein [Paeniclostridium sordellii]SCJ23545.1 D-alanyl-D-alanine carboxypeptidase dacC precursor [uncultured Clostridium sp.]MBC6002399.1 D-alanyl-D-alanine carboxypeptidase [Paeniclostridium hominis]MDU2592313.1 D-alanyl-D-alanine carboxypeptidase family protein [Paeniclostridium sordellii]SCJ23649.1 D-alanyl-D-alanine carboxypeptidase dacC precursor [